MALLLLFPSFFLSLPAFLSAALALLFLPTRKPTNAVTHTLQKHEEVGGGGGPSLESCCLKPSVIQLLFSLGGPEGFFQLTSPAPKTNQDPLGYHRCSSFPNLATPGPGTATSQQVHWSTFPRCHFLPSHSKWGYSWSLLPAALFKHSCLH